jgi:hypothetical protein
MKTRYCLTRQDIRGYTFYCVDTVARKRTSPRTTNEEEAPQIVEARNQSERQPVLNLQITKRIRPAPTTAGIQDNFAQL